MVASVVIPARNAGETLSLALTGLAAQQAAPEFEVIVVDDGSTDDTREIAGLLPELPVALLETSGGEGPGAARNLGAAVARGEFIVFLDADCEPEPGWLASLIAATEHADLVQGKVLPPSGVPIGPFDRFLAVVSEYGLYQTANLAIRRELFERIGGFEAIVMPQRSKELGEDAWLAWRARRAGARSTFAEEAVVRHAVFPRNAVGFVGEQMRVRFFPALVGHMPELRDAFLYRRWFLSYRSARFDLALAGTAASRAAHSPLPLVAALPYAQTIWKESGAWGRRLQPKVLPVQLTADVVRAGALLWGSLRYRRAVL